MGNDARSVKTTPPPSQEFLRSVLDTANEGIWLVDADARTVYANLRMAQILGVESDNLVGRSLFDFIDEANRGAAIARLRERELGFSERSEFTLRKADGSPVHVAYSANPVMDGAGRYGGTLAMVTDVTAQLNVEAKLSDLEQRLAVALETCRVGIWDWDIVADNVVWCESLDRYLDDSAATAPMSFAEAFDRVHPDDRERIGRFIEASRTDGSDFNALFRYVQPDGGVIWHESAARVVRDVAGKAVRMLGVSRDVSERIQQEQAQARLAAIVESSDDAILSYALDGTILTCNRAAERIYGYAADDVVGSSFLMLAPSDEQDSARRLIERVGRGERVENFETVRVRGDGRRFDASVTLSPIIDPAGHIIAVSAIVRDITERKRAELRLIESEHEYRMLADSGRALIWVSGVDKLCHYFNRAWLEFTGRTLDEERGFGWANGVHPDDFEHCVSIYASAFDRREPFSMDYRLRRHDGEYRWIQDDGCPRYASSGEFIGYVGYALEITDRKQAEEERERYTRELAASQANQRALARRLVEAQETERRHLARELHDEIGQELTGLTLTLELLSRSSNSDDRSRIDDAQTIVGELIARIRELSLELRPAMLDDLGLLPALLWHLKRFSKQTGIDVDFEHDWLEKCRFDATIETAAYRFVQEALTNIARHAHVDTAAVSVRTDNRVIEITVEDSGCGFDVDSTLQGARTCGLSSMIERARLVGGTVTIRSTAGGGAYLVMELPVDGPRAPEEYVNGRHEDHPRG